MKNQSFFRVMMVERDNDFLRMKEDNNGPRLAYNVARLWHPSTICLQYIE